MKLLFLHPNMPGQFKHVAKAYGADSGNQVIFITKPRDLSIPGVRKIQYKLPRDATSATHRYLIGAERGILQGQEVWRICKKLKTEEGFVPDIVVAHPGWGDAMFIKDIYPDTPLLSYFEFYYRSEGADVNFDPADPIRHDDRARIRVKNVTNLLSLESADWGMTPTHWQWSVHPPEFKQKISILHDGIDVNAITPDPNVTLTLPNGVKLTRDDEVVTYIARNFEPYRGFPTFMQAAKKLLELRPNCHIIAIGADGISYGKGVGGGKTYREVMTERLKPDLSRLHFVGTLAHDAMIKVLQLSSAHIYLTYPFVLSWSMLESMAAGCLVIGSDTPPVREVLTDGHNGLLVDFFKPDQVVNRINEVFRHKDRMAALRVAARDTVVSRFALQDLLPLQQSLIADVVAKRLPPPAAQRIDARHQQVSPVDWRKAS